MPVLGMLHTVLSVANLLDTLAADRLPGVARMHIVDEPLLAQVRADGKLVPTTQEQLIRHGQTLQHAGVDAILLSCSSISMAAPEVARATGLPVITIDQRLAQQTCAEFDEVIVCATLPTAAHATRELLQTTAERHSRRLHVREHVIAGAYDQLAAGAAAEHNRLVREGVAAALQDHAVVLAQASMYRAIEPLMGPDAPHSILAGPPLALAEAAELLPPD